jgi:hypothetical protein
VVKVLRVGLWVYQICNNACIGAGVMGMERSAAAKTAVARAAAETAVAGAVGKT